MTPPWPCALPIAFLPAGALIPRTRWRATALGGGGLPLRATPSDWHGEERGAGDTPLEENGGALG